MSGTGEVLQSYLVSLGFKTDAISLRKFENGLSTTGKRVLGVGAAVAGVVASVEAASAAFAYSMRKMYFQSELSGSTVKNLKAMEFAGKQIGITGDSMASSIHGMAQAMRLNPGLQGLIESFGVKVTGRNIDDVMIDYVKALKSMPEFAGAQYAGLFGIDPDTYHQMINHMDELSAKKQDLLNMYKNAGVDPDAAKATILEYTEAMDKLESKLSILAQSLLIKFAPVFKIISEGLNNLIDMVQTDLNPNEPQHQKNESVELAKRWSGIVLPAPKRYSRSAPGAVTNAAGAPSPGLFGNLEQQYGLPAGLLDKVWKQESGRGKNMTSPAGAKGHFQFMDQTAKQYGVEDPNNLEQSATGASKMLQHLRNKYGGDTGLALAAYNWGEGNMDSYLKTGKGAKGQAMPTETQNYVQSLTGAKLGERGGAGVSISQSTTIHVNGDNPDATAKSVAREQGRVNGDLVRNMKGSVS